MRYQVKCTQLSFGINAEARQGDVITDEDLAGADVERLIAIGAVAALDDAPAAEGEQDQDEVGETADLEKLTKSQLEDLADRMNLQLDPSRMTKAEMIQAIEEAQAADTDPDAGGEAGQAQD